MREKNICQISPRQEETKLFSRSNVQLTVSVHPNIKKIIKRNLIFLDSTENLANRDGIKNVLL